MITFYSLQNFRRRAFILLALATFGLPATPNPETYAYQETRFSSVVSPGELDESRLATQLALSEANRVELEKAIRLASVEQQAAVKFLISHMPVEDLQSLSADFLLTNVRLAYEARDKVSWQIPDDIFFNEVLPYACVDEPRDPWRQTFFELCWPLVRDCQTPSEAAQRLNETVFPKIGVKYSTGRRRANQSPRESMEQGLASCTGLSIILVDACRSVGVPARLVGIPSWKNKQGNHTWVEIWDQKWNFTGAAEPCERRIESRLVRETMRPWQIQNPSSIPFTRSAFDNVKLYSRWFGRRGKTSLPRM